MVNRKVVETLVACGVFDSLGENRATLAHNLDRLLEAVASSREARRYGQTVLFDALGRGGRPAGGAGAGAGVAAAGGAEPRDA